MFVHDREFRHALFAVLGVLVVLVVLSGWSKICAFTGMISDALLNVVANSLAVLHSSTEVSAILFLAIIVIYFIPTVIAIARNRNNVYQIFLCNLFFGWTILGWSVVLLWAAMKESTICYSNSSLRQCFSKLPLRNASFSNTPIKRIEKIRSINDSFLKLKLLQSQKRMVDDRSSIKLSLPVTKKFQIF